MKVKENIIKSIIFATANFNKIRETKKEFPLKQDYG